MSVFQARSGGWAVPLRRLLIESLSIHRPAEKSTGNTIADFLWPEDILLDRDVSSKPRFFAEIDRHMEREHAMPQAWVSASLSCRERIGSTGLGEGVAIPHARIKGLERIRLAYVRLTSPIPFDAPDSKPVSDILVLLVPQQSTEEHLRILAEAMQLFSDRPFRQRLHLCKHAQEVKHLFAAWAAPS